MLSGGSRCEQMFRFRSKVPISDEVEVVIALVLVGHGGLVLF